MRDKIRLPADVELSTKFTAGADALPEGDVSIEVLTVPNGKFNKITKIAIHFSGMQDAIVITPKERKPL